MEAMPMLMMALMILVAVLLVAGVVWLVRSLVRRSSHANSTTTVDDPEQLLARRFAEGEIEREEYEERRAVLRGGR